MHNSFDFAMAMFSFNYAPNVNVLNDMMKSLYLVLKPYGVAFVGAITMKINENPKLLRAAYGDERNEFGFKYHKNYDSLNNGQMATTTIGFTKQYSLEINDYYYDLQTYTEIANNNGFSLQLLTADDYIADERL
eukprot:396470_1